MTANYDVLYLVGLLVAGLSIVTAVEIARDRRRPGWMWGLAGLFAPVVAPVMVWLMPPNPRFFDDCASCKATVRKDATVCPHCARSRG